MPCRFLAAEDLPASYREQIVDFIISNSGSGAAVPATPSINVDPFTGGGAYIPSNASTSQQPRSSLPNSVTGGGADPFTGATLGVSLLHGPVHLQGSGAV